MKINQVVGDFLIWWLVAAYCSMGAWIGEAKIGGVDAGGNLVRIPFIVAATYSIFYIYKTNKKNKGLLVFVFLELVGFVVWNIHVFDKEDVLLNPVVSILYGAFVGVSFRYMRKRHEKKRGDSVEKNGQSRD